MMTCLFLLPTEVTTRMADNVTTNLSLMAPLSLNASVRATMSPDRRNAFAMQQCIFIILVIIGTVGHVLSIVVLSRPRMRYTSIYCYLFVLACSDTVVLWLSCFKTWVRIVAGYELLHESYAACKIVTFLYLSSTYLSSWLIVAMTIDRFIAVWFPLKVATLCSIRHARKTTAIMVFLAFFSNIHVFWTMHLVDKSCTYTHYYSYFMWNVFEPLKLAAYCFVPFAIVLSLNTALIYKLKWGSKYLHRQDTRDSTSSNAAGHDRIICLLLTVSFTWFFLTLPVSLLAYVPFLHDNPYGRTMCWVLMYTNHSINFYLYCLTGRKFQQELKEAFHCRTKDQTRSKVVNGSETSKTLLRTAEVNETFPLNSIVTTKQYNSKSAADV